MLISQLVSNFARHQDRTVELCEDYLHYIHFLKIVFGFTSGRNLSTE